MPPQDYYSAKTPPQAVRRLAEVHNRMKQRHISAYKFQLPTDVADAVEVLNRRCA